MNVSESFVSRIKFDAEDRLPPAYWNRLRSSSVTDEIKNLSKKTMDPLEWARAPEFVPKHRRSLVDSFGYINPLSNLPEDLNTNDFTYKSSNINNVNMYPFVEPNPIQSIPAGPYELQPSFPQTFPVNHVPLTPANVRCVPFPSSSPYDLVPKGYSANFAAINSGIGPPIAAIVLKKKRKRRPRKSIQKLDKNANEGPILSREEQNSESRERDLQTFPKRYSSEQNLVNATSLDSLHQTEKRITRAFSCPHFSDEQLTLWDDILYNAMCNQNKQQLSQKAIEQRPRRKEAENQKLTSTFETELKNSEDLSENQKEAEMRPYLYGNSNMSQNKTWTTWNPKLESTFHQICNPDYDMIGKVEEDYYEGMRIQVNAFNNLEDKTFSDSENERQSTFSQMQWTLQNERTCCNII